MAESGVTGLEGGDALWYKDAVIYEVHVRAFCDSDSDGVGDFAGLTEKLDYLKDLGVTAIWLFPLYPPPPLVPAPPPRRARQLRAQLLRLERHAGALQAGARNLQRLRVVKLVMGSCRRGLLLAPLLSPPARPQLRQPARPRGDHARHGLLAGDGRPPGGLGPHPLPLRERRHELREPAPDLRVPPPAARPHRRALQRPRPPGGGEPFPRQRLFPL